MPDQGNLPANVVEPLTRVSKKGILYARPAEIEKEIAGYLEKPLQSLADDIGTAKPPSSSCLVHFARRFRPNSRSALWDRLLVTLLDRIDGQVSGNLFGVPPELHQEVRDRVSMGFLERLKKNEDSLDVFEIRFALAVKTTVMDARRAVKRHSRREIAIEDLADPGTESSGYDALDAIRYRAGEVERPQGETMAELKQVLQRLTPDERKAVIAVYTMGLKEHSSNPDEVTAAKLLNVTDRTIRNLLARARTKAKDGEEHSS